MLVGRDIIKDRWSFQVVEDYDENYWEVFRAMERRARAQLGDAEPHIYEAEMKVSEQDGEPPELTRRLSWLRAGPGSGGE